MGIGRDESRPYRDDAMYLTLVGARRHEIRPRLGAAGLEAVVGAILVIARIGFAAIVRANTRFAPTEGGWNGDGICLDRTPLLVFCGGRDESRPLPPILNKRGVVLV